MGSISDKILKRNINLIHCLTTADMGVHQRGGGDFGVLLSRWTGEQSWAVTFTAK